MTRPRTRLTDCHFWLNRQPELVRAATKLIETR